MSEKSEISISCIAIFRKHSPPYAAKMLRGRKESRSFEKISKGHHKQIRNKLLV
jgi:hypothetical protein